MRFVTFIPGTQTNQQHVGLLKPGCLLESPQDQVLDLTTYANSALPFKSTLFADMLALIQNQNETLPLCQTALKEWTSGQLKNAPVFAAQDVTFLSPIPRPTSMRDGYAFRQHVESARKGRGLPMIPEFDLFPIFYFTNALAVTGPGPIAVQKKAMEDLDFELEVAVVIGKGGKNIPAAKADQHIFGYMIMNDWSARSFQREEMKLNLGPAKGKDFATSLGPILVTRDELNASRIDSPQGERFNLRMKMFLNGKQYADGNLKDMNWTFAQIIERASYGARMEIGEVIGSGTVGTGCFMELNGSKITDNLWIKAGDVVRLEIEGMGQLTNTIVAASEAYEADL